MTPLQIYLMLAVATSVFASKHTRHESDDAVGIPPWSSPRSYRIHEFDNSAGIPPWRTHAKRSSTRYGAANSRKQDSARSTFQKLRSVATSNVRRADQSAEAQPKKTDLPWTKSRTAKSVGQDCAISPVRGRNPMARDVCSAKQSAESRLKKGINSSFLPPVLVPLQRANEHEQIFRGQSLPRRLSTNKSRKSALCVEGTSAGSCLKEDSLLEAAQVLSAFHSFDQVGKNGDSFKHEDQSGDSFEHASGNIFVQHEECGDIVNREESGDSFDHEESGDSCDHEESGDSCDDEESGDSCDHEESGDSCDHEEGSGAGYEDVVQTSDVVHPAFSNSFAHVTPADIFNLSWPDVKECRERMKYVYSIDTQGFYLNSWELPENVLIDPHTGEKLSKRFTWVEARNQCRKRCMDLISFETSSELGFYSGVFAASNLPFVWTSGRICDYEECANRPELKPFHLNGWFWTATGERLPPTNAKPPQWSFQPWSPSGISNDPQPDNAEFAINGKNESCLALMNNVYGDRIAYHDVACYHKKYFTCEDSPILIELVYRTHGVKLIRPHTFVN